MVEGLGYIYPSIGLPIDRSIYPSYLSVDQSADLSVSGETDTNQDDCSSTSFDIEALYFP